MLDIGSRRPAPPPPPRAKPAVHHAAAKPAAHAAPAAPKKPAVKSNFHMDGFDRTIAHGSFDKGVAAVSAKGSFKSKHVSGGGEVNLAHASVNGEGSVKADLRHGKLSAEGSVGAKANLVDAKGHLDVNSRLGRTRVEAHGNVGAEANAKGKIEFDPRHGSLGADAHVDAFAGARAGVNVSHKIGPVSGNAGVEGEAGIGVNLDAKAGFDHGKLSAKLDIGAALGIGADIKVGGSIDVGGAVHGAENVAKKGWHAITSIF
jgi:hypothetical protein